MCLDPDTTSRGYFSWAALISGENTHNILREYKLGSYDVIVTTYDMAKNLRTELYDLDFSCSERASPATPPAANAPAESLVVRHKSSPTRSTS